MNMILILSFIVSAFNLGNNQVDIKNDDYSAKIRFYNSTGVLIKELIVNDLYGYKAAQEGKFLYILNKDGINIYDGDGKRQRVISDNGTIAVSPQDAYLVCASDNIVRVYKHFKYSFQVILNSPAIKQIIFSSENQYLGAMTRNEFTLVTLPAQQIIWTKEFSEPLIYCKMVDNLVIVVSENRGALSGKVFIISLAGETQKEQSFCYLRNDEQIQNIDITHNSIKAGTHLREWILGESESEFRNTITTATYPLFLSESIPWPVPPTSSFHCLGNNWFEYQNYGGSAYFHPGIDVITPGDSGVAVYAVKNGFVKAWLSTGDKYYWRFGIGDSSLSFTDSCNGYLYAHIDSARYHKDIGDTVNVDDLIGYLVPWMVEGFNHCHFAKIRDRGSTWTTADWAFIYNPLLSVQPNNDTTPPTFLNAVTNQKFAFARNATSAYLSSTSLNGDVDIIAKIYDKLGISTGDTIWDRLCPLKIEYEIIGQTVSQPRKLSFIFDKVVPSGSSLVGVVYKSDNTCRTRGDYDYRDYYFVVTNTDGDSILETTDAAISWQTSNFPNGNYWVKVYAYDAKNNVSVCSMQVTVNNNPGIEEEGIVKKVKFADRMIFNALGQKLKNENPTELKQGVYFYCQNNSMHKILVIKPNVYFISPTN
jgi:murein DD-endopeptidase MepM/ murein hydrolase activator NlpD